LNGVGQQPAIGFAESALNGSAGNIAPREGAQLRINGGKLRIHRVTSSGGAALRRDRCS
jgi:hypothetical protein